MGLKRKLSINFDDEHAAFTQTTKRGKLIPFPGAEPDSDVAMTDGSISELSPLAIPSLSFHTRLTSDASYLSTTSSLADSPQSSLSYPEFDLYPEPQDDMAVDSNYFDHSGNSSPRMVGLIQPRGSAFTHHGDGCSQIPKLRMACSSGLNGQRSMWAHCEQCGAIEMVETD